MELRFWAATDTGRVRDHNEDNFLVDQNLQLFVVCDGMGGHAAGEVASAVCVRTVRDVIDAERGLLNRLRDNPADKVAVEKLKQLLRHAVLTSSRRIFEMAQQDPSRRGMGTTCVALVLVGKRGFVGHVGDSRMYRIRSDELEQITDDHSLLNEMIRQGKVPPDTSEATFRHKNAVTRAVGVRETVDVDAFTFDIEAGDRVLMCSDGLSEYFGDSVDLQSLTNGADPEETTQRCIDFANQSGGKDNITVVVIDCGPRAQKEAKSGPKKAEVIEILRTTPYFHYLAPPELEKIRQMATRYDVDADKDVVADDEDNDRFYLILKGSVSLQLDGEQISVLTTGEHFGEMALIDAQDEQDTNLVAKTVEPSTFLTVERDQFVNLLRSEPGLAIKLLWNFVQVFADRLQSVPPEYRYTPDEWRSDPEAIADVTPPSGTLVFEDDLARMKESNPRSGKKEISAEGPPDLPGHISAAGVASSAPSRAAMKPASGEVAEDPLAGSDDPGRTVKMEAFSREGMDTIPPGLEADEVSAPSTTPRKKDGPSVAFNRATARREPRNPAAPVGLSSGTYDQSILEEGLSDEIDPDEIDTTEIDPVDVRSGRDDEPGDTGATVKFNRRDRKATAQPVKGEADNLKQTMKIDWSSDSEGGPPPFDKTKVRSGSRQAQVTAGRKGNATKDRRQAISGRTAVTSDEEDDLPVAEEPKVMIASDLVADAEEEDSP